MEQPTVSRFNSQSTSRTLIGSDNGFVSPILSPLDGGGQLPIVQTPDSRQWIDLDYLSPKIVKELRRQYDPSIKDEPNGPLARGAAKVKAWARSSKLGIEIRLRRKLSPDQDEVTDIHLVPNTLDPPFGFRDKKLPLIAELPATSSLLPELPGEITEMPDTSTKAELSGVSIPSRTSTDSTLGEPLPRYEPRQDQDTGDITSSDGNRRTQSPERVPQASHAHTPSQDSILATPTSGLPVRDLSTSDVDDAYLSLNDQPEAKQDDKIETAGTVEGEPDDRQTADKESNQQLNKEREVSQQFQEFLKALQDEQREAQEGSKGVKGVKPDEDIEKSARTEDVFRHLKLVKTTRYETETDVEPPSPVKRKPARPAKGKNVAMPRRKKSLLVPRPANKNANNSDEDLDEEHDPLLRRPTLPKRVSASAGAEAVWRSLIRMQEKIVGPEHPYVYQAKSDLARSRINGHVKGDEDLVTLRKSRQFASETLGDVHPWVAAFSEDLGKLEKLTNASSSEKPTTYRISDFEKDSGASMSYRGADARQLSPSLEQGAHDAVPETRLDERASSDVQTSEAASRKANTEVPRIITDLVEQDRPSFSQETGLAGHPPHADALWSSSRPPHEPRSALAVLPSLILGGMTKAAFNGISWIQRNYGPEQPVEPGKVRVRWTCCCGAQLHDDFVERRHGAARELERYLNRPKTLTGGNGSPTSPSSSTGSRSFMNSSIGGSLSPQTPWSSYGFPGSGSTSFNGNTKPPQTLTGASMFPPYSPHPEPPWLLTCANEDRYTPKLAHLDMAPHKIRSDKDLALSLREHYFHVNKKWWRMLRLRGLTTIEFVQLEVHQNRFADIRKCPDMPPVATGEYNFEPADLLPPVSPLP
jgi:hypothetical protein